MSNVILFNSRKHNANKEKENKVISINEQHELANEKEYHALHFHPKQYNDGEFWDMRNIQNYFKENPKPQFMSLEEILKEASKGKGFIPSECKRIVTNDGKYKRTLGFGKYSAYVRL